MAFLSRLIELFDSKKADKSSPRSGSITADKPRIADGQRLIHNYWSSIGRIAEHGIEFDSEFKDIGTPFWPSKREEYLAVHIDGGLVIGTDGLSDPFVESDCNEGNGLGLEFYIEIASPNSESHLDKYELPELIVLEQVAYNAIINGRFRELIDELGILSMTISVEGELGERWEDADGLTGLLLWVPPERRNWELALPSGKVLFVAVTPLLPEELSYAAQSATNRDALADALVQSRDGHRFNQNRAALSLIAMS